MLAFDLPKIVKENRMAWLTKFGLCAAIALSAATAALGEDDQTSLQQLHEVEIRQALSGKFVSYDPGCCDNRMHEEFHADGKWRGILYGRGPMPFTGRWTIDHDQLCTIADPGSLAESWHEGEYCRDVMRNNESTKLIMEYLQDRTSSSHKHGLQVLEVGDIAPPRKGISRDWFRP